MTQGTTAELQQQFWNEWNSSTREQRLDKVSREQAAVVCSWLRALDLKDARLIEVGCGAGWLSPQLASFGQVVATDLAAEVLDNARPSVTPWWSA